MSKTKAGSVFDTPLMTGTAPRWEFVPGEEITLSGRTLRRIRALVDIPKHGVRAGDIGGYVEREESLDRFYGDAWVSDNAQVFGMARVRGVAHVSGNARVFGEADVTGGFISGSAMVFGNAQVSGHARISGRARVGGNALVSGGVVTDDARVSGDAEVYGDAQVSGHARVFGDASVFGDAKLTRRARVGSAGQAVWFSGFGRGDRTVTMYNTSEVAIEIMCIGVHFSVDEFRAWSAREFDEQTHQEHMMIVAAGRSRIEATRARAAGKRK